MTPGMGVIYGRYFKLDRTMHFSMMLIHYYTPMTYLEFTSMRIPVFDI